MGDTRVSEILTASGCGGDDTNCEVWHKAKEGFVCVFSTDNERSHSLGRVASAQENLAAVWREQRAGLLQESIYKGYVSRPDGRSPEIRRYSYLVPVFPNGIVAFSSFGNGFQDEAVLDRLDGVAESVQKVFLLSEEGSEFQMLLPESKLWTPDRSVQVGPTILDVTDAIMRELAANPSRLHQLDPRAFEELVARLLADLGYLVKLTQAKKDGGYDILAELLLPTGRVLTLVECKKWSPSRPVGVEVVRNVYGVLNSNNATNAMIATTAHFTRGAREMQDANQFQLTLTDFHDVARWLQRYGSK